MIVPNKGMAGVRLFMSSSEVRHRLGRPDAVTRSKAFGARTTRYTLPLPAAHRVPRFVPPKNIRCVVQAYRLKADRSRRGGRRAILVVLLTVGVTSHAACGSSSPTSTTVSQDGSKRTIRNIERELADFPSFPLYWVGASAGSWPLVTTHDPAREYWAGFEGVTFLYGEICSSGSHGEAGTCNYPVQITNYQLCDRYAGMIDLPRKDVRVNALPGSVVGYAVVGGRPGERKLILYSQQTTIEISAHTLEEATAVARYLRRVTKSGNGGPPAPYRGKIAHGRPADC